jgi:hypothetical protein
MRRDPSLIPLSHDHQHALARALRLRRAAALEPKGRADAAAAFLAFADERLGPHFEVEERLLAIASEAAPELAAHDARLRREHEELHAAIEFLRDASAAGAPLDPELLVATGQQLTDHVRYEERELFQALQVTFADDELESLAAAAGHD